MPFSAPFGNRPRTRKNWGAGSLSSTILKNSRIVTHATDREFEEQTFFSTVVGSCSGCFPGSGGGLSCRASKTRSRARTRILAQLGGVGGDQRIPGSRQTRISSGRRYLDGSDFPARL